MENDGLPKRNRYFLENRKTFTDGGPTAAKVPLMKSGFRACVLFCNIRYKFCFKNIAGLLKIPRSQPQGSKRGVFYKYLVYFIFRHGNSRTLRQLNVFTLFWNGGTF